MNFERVTELQIMLELVKGYGNRQFKIEISVPELHVATYLQLCHSFSYHRPPCSHGYPDTVSLQHDKFLGLKEMLGFTSGYI